MLDCEIFLILRVTNVIGNLSYDEQCFCIEVRMPDNGVVHAMTTEGLSAEIKEIAAALKRVEQRLQKEPAPDQIALNEFRQTVDNVRLTAWSVSELINAERVKKDPNTVLAFLSAERLRRFDQLVKNLCSDIERQVITVQTHGMHSLTESVNKLQQRLIQCTNPRVRFTGKMNAPPLP